MGPPGTGPPDMGPPDTGPPGTGLPGTGPPDTRPSSQASCDPDEQRWGLGGGGDSGGGSAAVGSAQIRYRFCRRADCVCWAVEWGMGEEEIISGCLQGCLTQKMRRKLPLREMEKLQVDRRRQAETRR